MRGDTNFKGSDSSDPSVYFLLCGNSQFSVSISKCNYLARICVMNMRNATYVGTHATFKGSDPSDSFVSFLFFSVTWLSYTFIILVHLIAFPKFIERLVSNWHYGAELGNKTIDDVPNLAPLYHCRRVRHQSSFELRKGELQCRQPATHAHLLNYENENVTFLWVFTRSYTSLFVSCS